MLLGAHSWSLRTNAGEASLSSSPSLSFDSGLLALVMPDQVDLTADALAALSLHQQQQQQQQRAAAPSDSASTHDWSAMTDEENAAFSSSLVSSFVMLPSSFGAASSAQKILFYPSLVYNFRVLMC